MKKLAFTLAEVLITLSIIGVIAAIAAPAISSAKPDASKIQYLKIYDHLTRVTQDLAGNGLIFAPLFPSNDRINCSNAAGANLYNVSTVPLINVCASQDRRFEGFNGYTKFGQILADVLGGTNINLQNVNDPQNNAVTFTTQDGMNWNIGYRRFDGGGNHRAYYRVLVDTNGGEGPDHVYESGAIFFNSNRRPDQFVFFISASGTVYPVDECGQMYVATRLITSSRERYTQVIERGNNGNAYTDEDHFNLALVSIDYDSEVPQIN